MEHQTPLICPTIAGRSISVRPIEAGDQAVLLGIYASTRAEELAQVDWDEAQKQAFLAMQFAAQHAYYQQNYDGAAFGLISVDGQPAGRLYLIRWERELRIIDIALLPAYHGQGIGSAFLQAILDQAVLANVPVSIHVERFNRALHLYERLGFRVSEDKGVYLLMVWSKE